MPVLRIIYEKKHTACFISSNYIGRVFERALRRLQLNLKFSQGFSRKVKMSFGPPLAVGMAGKNEVIDVHLEDSSISDNTIKERLNKILPEGLYVIETRYLKEGEKSPPAIKKGIYVVKIKDELPILPAYWKIISRKNDILEIEIPFEKFKHKELFEIFGQPNVVERFLIFEQN